MYDQLEVIPIYQTFCMLAWMSIGLGIFDEYKFYPTEHILAFAGAVVICLIGVRILVSKKRAPENGSGSSDDSKRRKEEVNSNN